jgi:nicotinate-nucleotide pyrophosphorylase (carboxylating)
LTGKHVLLFGDFSLHLQPLKKTRSFMNPLIDELIRLAFAEDIGDGDHTSLSCIPPDACGKLKLIVKEDGILAGVAIAERIFDYFDKNLTINVFIADGTAVRVGDIAFSVEGKVQSLLQTERLILNVMQRMSGVATTTRKYVERLEGTGTRVLDTRKTTPGMRLLEKEAVRIGGGVNHRTGLFDMILLKDNHVDFAGGITNAIKRAQQYVRDKQKDLKIEIEVRDFDELQEALNFGGIDRIMLDNFSVEDTRKAVRMVGNRYETESSGGITFDTLRDYAETGVDFISVGALTHSVKSLDMSLKAY